MSTPRKARASSSPLMGSEDTVLQTMEHGDAGSLEKLKLDRSCASLSAPPLPPKKEKNKKKYAHMEIAVKFCFPDLKF